MPEIEQRLRDDAARNQRVPDFDSALHSAMGEKRRSRTWPAVAAAVVLIAGSALAASAVHGDHQPDGTGAGPSAAASPPTPLLAGAIVEPSSEAPKQIMLVLRQPGRSCPQFLTSITETATQIRVRVRVDATSPTLGEPAKRLPVGIGNSTRAPKAIRHAPSTQTPTSAPINLLVPLCTSGYTAVVQGLHDPLGNRTVIDVSTGSVVPLLDRPAPLPAYLPAGFKLIDNKSQTDPMSSAPADFNPGSLAPLSVARFFGVGTRSRLIVATSPSDTVIPGASVVDHVSVHGHNANVTETPDTRCLTWLAAPGDGMQVCSNGHGDGPTLSETTLLQVAHSLPH